jgi:alanyl-tRNA synthetase
MHVSQMGSLVNPERLRFDFSHHSAVSDDEMERIEDLVNEKILEDLPVETRIMDIEEATRSGALAFFAEKYARLVRVVSIGDFSRELCGGTHVSRTGRIGCLKLVDESAVGTGIRRLEAVAGTAALKNYQNIEKILRVSASQLRVGSADLPEAISRARDREKEMHRLVDDLEHSLARFRTEDLLRLATEVDGIRFVTGEIPGASPEALRRCGDFIRERLPSGVIFLSSSDRSKVSILCMVTPDLIERGIGAGALLKSIAPLVDGSGGGRPDMAQGGGRKPEGMGQAVAHMRQKLSEALGKREESRR